ncbi:NAD(P)/FAD-dependent oxidoreductase [Agrobacterium rhizogenes]|uniref:flavin-containing monooxygenase n=1 Tax=Rhizobium rhizogenes TaxID=359 RepID=UPI0022B6B895|nr:NAD(P)/FAD-dependent oxidoreductase [Rhizobium rhizogenes]MCZ7449665.1 NAD(P)/FAD-dependent oxidoreductase [Rhizobium rhizogenes]
MIEDRKTNALSDELSGLPALEAQLARELALLERPAKPWVPRMLLDRVEVLDVVVIGAGLCGLTALAALSFTGIDNIRAFDRASSGLEGPWVTSARMETLRTRKELAGPALGVPSLTFRAWFEAQFGARAYDDMELIPREMWMAYMVWYRTVLALPVSNDTALVSLVLREDGLLDLDLQGPEGRRNILARRVILATGLDGLGAPRLPDVAKTVSARFVRHSGDIFDVSALRGKRIAVVGAGASAMDNAAAALEAGAARVDLFIRRPDVPRVEKFGGIASLGMTHGYIGLPDADRWAFMVEAERTQIPPPRHSVLRVSRHTNAFFHLASPLLSLTEVGDAVEIETPKGRYPADLVIFATGFDVDFARRPEFAGLSDRVLLWRDSYQPPAEQSNDALGSYPYLGPAFEFLPKPDLPAREAETISRIHCFAYPAVPSHGKITSGIPAVSQGAERLAQGVARSLFVEDRARHFDTFMNHDAAEITGDEWRDADAQDKIKEHANG